jgi:hypothetical protein
MVRMRYLGVRDPAAAFERFRPWRAELDAMRRSCRPMGPDYIALTEALHALDRCADQLTGQANFFRGRAPGHSSW